MEFRMTAITAKDNPSIQLYRKLVRQRKARTQIQQFELEGYRLVTDAVHFSRKLTHLFLTEAAWERYQEEFCSLEADLRETKRLLISNELAMELTETEHPQGVFAICQMPAEQVPIVAEGTYLVLYQLQDPGNMGMLLRTAAAMGVSGVICCQSCDFYSPKVVRATMGALFHVPVMQMPDAETVLQSLRAVNIVSCASVVQGDAEQVGLCELGNGCAVWIGNEGNGLPESVVQQCERRITIPMKGYMESLNAAMAAGIMMWEMTKPR